jgi:hypothetical protein
MTVSGVHTFTLNRDELIREALELTGTIDIGSPVPAEVLASCARTLNLYSKSWQAKGLFIHTYQDAILPLVQSQQSYLLGPGGEATETDGTTLIIRPLKITDVRHKIGTIETPITKLSISEYNNLTNKDSESQPSQYAYDPQIDNSRLYVWPVADSVTQSLLFKYQKPVDDFTTDSDTATMPVDWLQCFTLGLAYHVSPKRMVPLSEQAALKKRYEDALDDLDDFEETSVFFSPGTR